MKKLILTAAAAMMVLASCTKTKVESIDGPKEIAFKKIEGAMTKETLDDMNDGTMGVFAYLNGETTPYFGNTSFEKDGNFWAGGKYWPLNDQALDFVVYAPYMSLEGNTKIGYENKTLTFTIADNTSSQTDYLYGSEYYDNNDTNEGTGFVYSVNGVAVSLKHALAKITVKVKAIAAGVFKITNMTLYDTEQSGTITVVYDGNDDASVQSCVALTPGTQDTDTEMILLNSETNVTTDFNDVTKTCLVFPGDQTNIRHQTSLKITYKMEGLGETELTTTLNLQADPSHPSSTWDSGKHYIYNLTLTANEILFNPTVDDWNDEVVKNKNIAGEDNVNLQ